MKPHTILRSPVSSIIAICATVLMLAASPVGAQPFGQVEGSRPGQTYQQGQATPQQNAPQQQVPGQAAPQQPVQGYGQAAPAVQQGQYSPQGAAAVPPGQQVLAAGTPVIMEFSDLQCPDSARYNSDLKSTVMQRYVGQGKAAYQWHDFPLPNHEQADEAAAAARCAGTKADRMRQMIMANQAQMTENAYIQYARQLGVNAEQFTACLRSGSTMQEVQRDKALGQSYGVSGTPTLVLGTADGRGGVQPVKVVKAYNPPQQVLAEIDQFMAQVNSQGAAAPQPQQQNTN